jgi:hypothetical protein
MALKDASQLVKMYAMVNVSQYQIVATGSSVMECEANYRAMLARSGLISEAQSEVAPADAAERHEFTGTISDIRSAVVNGNSVYFLYLRAGGGLDGGVFRADASRIAIAPLLSVGDTVTVSYRDTDVAQYWTDAADIAVS